jgi:serine/threonine protein kinase
VAHLAQDIDRQGRPVVVKLFAVPAEVQERIRREAPAIQGIQHEHIARMIDAFDSGDHSVVVSEYVEGQDLAARLASGGPLAAEEVAAIGRGVALALQAAHRAGVLQRGVSPKTIILAPETRARLTDLGVGDIDGDRDYRAPEVSAGQGADVRADLYGLGLTLYTLLTGALPPARTREVAPPPAPDGHRPSLVRGTVPPWLDDAIAQATAALPADRFPSAGKLAEALSPGPLVRPREGLGAGR